MNILCNEGGFEGEIVNEGDLGCYEGDWSKMREPPTKWGSVDNYDCSRTIIQVMRRAQTQENSFKHIRQQRVIIDLIIPIHNYTFIDII